MHIGLGLTIGNPIFGGGRSAAPPWSRVLELAIADGWSAVYDPSNPNTRTLRDEYITTVADGLESMPSLAQGTAESQPRLSAKSFGAFDGMEFSDTAKRLLTSSVTAKVQPNLILALVKPETTVPGADRYVLDGITSTNRHAIGIKSSNEHRMFSGGDVGFGAVRDVNVQLWSANFNTPSTATYSGFSVNGVLKNMNSNTGANTLTGLCVGDRYANTGTHWRGLIGPILIHDSPTLAVRVRMETLLMELSEIAETLSVSAPYAYAMYSNGTEIYAKSADTVRNLYSITKVITALTVARWVTNFAATYTVVADDLVGGSTASLQAGDIITITDLLYGAALPSGNDAATALAHAVGQMILDDESGGIGDPLARFYAEMQDVVDTLNLSVTAGSNAWGGASGTARETAALLKALTDIPLMQTIFGAASYQITITGANARQYTVNSSVISVLWEDMYVAGKTGTGEGVYNSVIKADRFGADVIAVSLGATSETSRNLTIRNILDSLRITS